MPLNIDEIRLTEEELEETIHMRDSANTATDKANKWWVEWLSNNIYLGKFYSWNEDCWGISLKDYESLNELVKK